jgi:S1-C subfamily serine protease
MNEAANDQFTWSCSACGRRVPRRIDACRCGTRRQSSSASLDPSGPAEPETKAGGYGVLLVVVAVITVAGLTLIPWRSEPAPAASPRAAAASSPPPVERRPAEAPTPFLPDDIRAVAQGESPQTPTLPTAPSAVLLEDMIGRVIPAVVSIEAGPSRGTGFYIRPDRVLTNAHVIEGHSSVDLLAGDTRRKARVTTVSAASDLALLQVYEHDPRQAALPLGSVTGVRVGQEAIAVGSALGVLSNTVTRGIVSAVRRAGAITLIQTDAAINPGNSGGPLLDRSGTVIGINSLKIGRAAESLGFAVAIDHATALLGGGSAAPATTTAAAPGLDTILRRAPPSSDGARMRAQGEQQFARVLEAAARTADQLDAYWDRSARTCVASSSQAGDRRWFAVYEAHGIRLNAQVSGCHTWLDNLTANAGRVRDEMRGAAESARQSGVYPGVMRDLLRRHRMEREW